jgi:hypothetical protein
VWLAVGVGVFSGSDSGGGDLEQTSSFWFELVVSSLTPSGYVPATPNDNTMDAMDVDGWNLGGARRDQCRGTSVQGMQGEYGPRRPSMSVFSTLLPLTFWRPSPCHN